jgi:hypothetical protein
MASREKYSSLSVVSDLQANFNLPDPSGQESGTQSPDPVATVAGTASPANGSGRGDPPETPNPAPAAAVPPPPPSPPTDAVASGAPEKAPNPFNAASIRLAPDFVETAGTKKMVTTVPIKEMPGKQDWIRTHWDPAYTVTPVAFVKLEEERELYGIAPHIAAGLPEYEYYKAHLILAITRQGTPFFWAAKISTGSQGLSWYNSRLVAIEQTQKQWCRVVPNIQASGYDLIVTRGNIPDPQWPDMPMEDLLQIAFKNKYVDREDHPLFDKLWG